MKLLENIEAILFLIVFCCILWLFKSCEKDNTIQPIKITEVKYKDTIFPRDTVYEDRWHPSKLKHDTVWIPLPIDSVDCSKVYSYKDTIVRKEYDVYTNTIVQGTIREMGLSVKLKVPLIIKDCTIVKKDSLIYRPHNYLFRGGILVGNNFLTPTIDFTVNKSTYILGYNLLNNQIITGFKYQIIGWTPKNKKK